jgi:hypothetical protein
MTRCNFCGAENIAPEHECSLQALKNRVHFLQERHAKAVEKAWRAGYVEGCDTYEVDAAWLASEAKKGLI